MENMLRNLLGTWGTYWEADGNLKGTHWEYMGNPGKMKKILPSQPLANHGD
jgi:hypothetical protein